MSIVDTCANELRRLADEARRLPSPSRRDPRAFLSARAELARRMDDLARLLSGNIAAGAPRAPIRPGRATGPCGRAVPVEVRRKRQVTS
jgi:hypothetical protein